MTRQAPQHPRCIHEVTEATSLFTSDLQTPSPLCDTFQRLGFSRSSGRKAYGGGDLTSLLGMGWNSKVKWDQVTGGS